MAMFEERAVFSSIIAKASLSIGADFKSEKGRLNFLAKAIESSSVLLIWISESFFSSSTSFLFWVDVGIEISIFILTFCIVRFMNKYMGNFVNPALEE